jgi:hypothetical protein
LPPSRPSPASAETPGPLTHLPADLLRAAREESKCHGPSAEQGQRFHRLGERRRRLVERVQHDLREHVDLQFDIGDEIVEVIVERRRPKVVEVLARTDPFHSERALTFSQEGEYVDIEESKWGCPAEGVRQ